MRDLTRQNIWENLKVIAPLSAFERRKAQESAVERLKAPKSGFFSRRLGARAATRRITLIKFYTDLRARTTSGFYATLPKDG